VVVEQNLSLSGATILVKVTTTRVVSDMNGKFEIQMPEGKKIITISYIGFNSVDFGYLPILLYLK
jgi:hypothetical protein